MDGFIRGVSLARNVDGIIVTIPHKFSAYGHCATATERAHFLGAVNTMRRNADGTWHGDQLDGAGFVDGIRAAGCKPEGRRALMAGAGGAGSAIALALLDAGVEILDIHDGDSGTPRRACGALAHALWRKSARGFGGPVGAHADSQRHTGRHARRRSFPVQADKLTRDMFVGDVITAPAVTPLIEAARASAAGRRSAAACSSPCGS